MPVLVPHGVGVAAVAGAAAPGTGNFHIGQKLHVQTDDAGAVTDRAAQLACVVGEVARLVAQPPGIGRAGKNLAQLVVYIGVGRHGGAHVDANRRCIDELYLRDAVGLDGPYVGRQRLASRLRRQRRDKAFQNQRRLAGAGHTRDNGQPPLGNVHLQRLDRMDGVRRKMDAPLGKQLRRRAVPGRSTPLPTQKRADLGRRVPGQVGHRALGNDVPAARTGLGAHLDEPVRLRQHLCVVINEHHRVAVGDQVVHDAVQADDVGGVQPDGRLVQHVQNARGAVAHGASQLHPLALTGGKR